MQPWRSTARSLVDPAANWLSRGGVRATPRLCFLHAVLCSSNSANCLETDECKPAALPGHFVVDDTGIVLSECQSPSLTRMRSRIRRPQSMRSPPLLVAGYTQDLQRKPATAPGTHRATRVASQHALSTDTGAGTKLLRTSSFVTVGSNPRSISVWCGCPGSASRYCSSPRPPYSLHSVTSRPMRQKQRERPQGPVRAAVS
jgi:hypothetical protein